jgi:hypothetical protein
MMLTNDQYVALSKLNSWYNKYQHQLIEISGVVGTGVFDTIMGFVESTNLDKREIMYLSYNQKQVLDLAIKGYHAYYINHVLYEYIRITDFNTIPILNPASDHTKFEWKKKRKSKINPRYKLMVVFDSTLLDLQTIQDLASFGLPVILIRDPMLLPAPNTFTFLRDANIELNEVNPEYIKNPIVYFAHKIINGETLKYGNYDNVSIVPRRQMNLYNLKVSDMNITVSEELRHAINNIYRNRVMHRKDIVNVVGERVITESSIYNEGLVNNDNKNVKVHLTKGLVGYLTKVNKHAPTTKYVTVNFKPEFYHDEFLDLVMDRHHLNNFDLKSTQIVPDEPMKFSYAYALSANISRISHWDKVTFIIDNTNNDIDLQKRLIYTGITRAKRMLNIII